MSISQRLEQMAVEAAQGIAEEAKSGTSGLIARVHRQIEEVLRTEGTQADVDAYTTKFLQELGNAAGPTVADSFRKELDLLRQSASSTSPSTSSAGENKKEDKTAHTPLKVSVPVWNRPSTMVKWDFKKIAERKLSRRIGGVWGAARQALEKRSISADTKSDPSKETTKVELTKNTHAQVDPKAKADTQDAKVASSDKKDPKVGDPKKH